MTTATITKAAIKPFIQERLAAYQALALDIHNHPEVSNYEFYSADALIAQLEKEGFAVKKDVAGHRTGFDARYVSGKPGPTIAFLAEYDALPGIGHACGHNLFGTYSVLAASALQPFIDELGGEIRVYGTPGEEGGENGSAKGSFVREGFFDDVDAALCVHPAHRYGKTTASLANDPVDIKFYGRASHAAAAPEKGINALEALLQVFNGINGLRLHLPKDVNIHGVITDGGVAANVVPEYAAGRFYLRAANRATLNDVYEKVENIVKLQIPAGKATPAPPVGPALGQAGINIMGFTKEFNARTADQAGMIIPVVISVYEDKSFDFITKTPPAAVLLKKAAGVEKGSGTPNSVKVASVTRAQVQEIAETKMPDLNAANIESAMRMIEGTARSMGFTVTD